MSRKAIKTYQAMLNNPPTIASSMVKPASPGAKEAQISKTNKHPKPAIPAYAVALLKTRLRYITIDMIMPEISENRNPKKVPGVWLWPTESIAWAAAVIIAF